MNTKTPPLLLLLLLLIALCWTCGESASPSNSETMNRIVGGTQVSITKQPYMVAILRRGDYHCAGSLITRSHVLTAGHCLHQQVPANLVAVAGTTDIRQRGVRRNFVRFFVHSKFNYDTIDFDVAVGKLQRSITAVNVRPQPLCNHSMNVGGKLKLSGWGTTSESSTTSVNELRTVSMPLVSWQWCKRQYSGVENITPRMVCAGGAGKRDSCYGDSGGPALHQGQICGVVSFSAGCARRGFPGVFANVQNPSIKEHIERAMRQ